MHIVDVFAEAQLAGNQLAVIEDAASLSDAEMQAVALEMNYSETTFITARSDTEATVRIFTPGSELPFAGHPTLGTAWVLTQGRGRIVLNLAAGPVPVEFEADLGWMVPPPVSFHGELDAQRAAQLIGLDVSDLSAELPVEMLEVGPQFVIVPVRDLAALKKATFNVNLRDELIAQGLPARSVFVVSAEPYEPQADFASRMFFIASGPREDPATGSANSAFAAYLKKHKGNVGRVVVDQGVEINRPSRLYLDVADTLAVGGKVQPVVVGEMTL
ncbi:MAG: PhzF family phenazine biosynthesis isomerase [Pseudomonadales bacterium]|nr:PhzF family phenazine biosynthesis isomerase [Pseudomonadales bacterium]